MKRTWNDVDIEMKFLIPKLTSSVMNLRTALETRTRCGISIAVLQTSLCWGFRNTCYSNFCIF